MKKILFKPIILANNQNIIAISDSFLELLPILISMCRLINCDCFIHGWLFLSNIIITFILLFFISKKFNTVVNLLYEIYKQIESHTGSKKVQVNEL